MNNWSENQRDVKFGILGFNVFIFVMIKKKKTQRTISLMMVWFDIWWPKNGATG